MTTKIDVSDSDLGFDLPLFPGRSAKRQQAFPAPLGLRGRVIEMVNHPNRKRNAEIVSIRRRANRELKRRWLAEHPGRTGPEYTRLLQDSNSEVWQWRRQIGAAAIAAEAAAWLADHPGNPLPEHMCGMSDAAYAEYVAWQNPAKL
jgi:hypothetical protein